MQVNRPSKNWSVDLTVGSQMKGSPDRIQACTTTHFDGTVAVVNPEKSWVGRWQRTSSSCALSFFCVRLCLDVFVPCR